MCISKLWFSIHYSSQAEVPYLDITVRIKEDIARFEVSVEYFIILRASTTFLNLIIAPPVTVMQSHGNLR